MVQQEKTSLVGSWAFLVGVVLAILASFLPMQQWMAITLVLIGILVGILNITAREAMGFLQASAILVIVTALTNANDVFGVLGPWAPGILDALLLVFVPATIVVALRAVFTLAKN